MQRGRIYGAAFLAMATLAAPVWGQTSTTSSGGTTSTASTSSTSTSATTPDTTGAFQSLSPGQQKIARALFEAQQPSATGPAPLSLDQIAAMKQGTGWGQVFKQMKSEGLVGDAKNLGQVVSGHATANSSSTTSATTATTTAVTTANGRPVGAGGSHSSAGDGGQSHGNSAHVADAHATTAAGSSGHGNAANNGHAH